MSMSYNVGGDPYSNPALSGTKVAAVTNPCKIFNLQIFNPGAAVAYVQFFDAASGDVTVGSTTATRLRSVPPGGGIDTAYFAPMRFNTALTIAATTTPTGSSAPGTALVIDFDFVR